MAGIKEAQSTIDNFMLLYVFTNFAFSFEIVAKMTDFDQTTDLKTSYKLKEAEDWSSIATFWNLSPSYSLIIRIFSILHSPVWCY